MRAAVRKTLEKRQQALRDKNAGSLTREPGMPLAFVVQLAPMVRRVLTDPGHQETLAKALISAIEATEQVILAPESSPEDRVRSSNTLFWLFSVCQRHEQSLARSEARTEMAKVRSARAQAKKARALADRESVILTVAKERRKIDRKLRRAQAEIAAAPKETV